MKLLPLSVAQCKDLQKLISKILVAHLSNDLPTPSSLGTELHCWTVKWKGKVEDARDMDTPLKALASIDGDFFPNIKHLFQIACTFCHECRVRAFY